MASAGRTSSPGDGRAVVGYEPRPPRRRADVDVPRRLIVLCVGAAKLLSGCLLFRAGGLIDEFRRDPTAVLDIDLKLTTNFRFDPQVGTASDVPASVRALNGKRVRVRGYMYRPETASGSPGAVRFWLVYDVGSHPWGDVPVQERIVATAPAGVPVLDQYTLADVVGRFQVRVVRDAASCKVTQVFEMAADSVEPVE